MFRSCEFSGLCSAAERDIRVIRRWESNKNFIGGRKGRGIGRLDKTTERNGGIIGPEGRDSFIVFSSFGEVNSRGVSLTSFEVGLGSVSTLPLGIDGKRTRRGTVTEHNLWLTPVNMWVMLSEPGVAEDNVVMS